MTVRVAGMGGGADVVAIDITLSAYCAYPPRPSPLPLPARPRPSFRARMARDSETGSRNQASWPRRLCHLPPRCRELWQLAEVGSSLRRAVPAHRRSRPGSRLPAHGRHAKGWSSACTNVRPSPRSLFPRRCSRPKRRQGRLLRLPRGGGKGGCSALRWLPGMVAAGPAELGGGPAGLRGMLAAGRAQGEAPPGGLMPAGCAPAGSGARKRVAAALQPTGSSNSSSMSGMSCTNRRWHGRQAWQILALQRPVLHSQVVLIPQCSQSCQSSSGSGSRSRP